jgi:hypothetical protein
VPEVAGPLQALRDDRRATGLDAGQELDADDISPCWTLPSSSIPH